MHTNTLPKRQREREREMSGSNKRRSERYCLSLFPSYVLLLFHPPTVFYLSVSSAIFFCLKSRKRNFLQVNITPNWNANDPDENDVIKFTNIQPNDNGRFKINENTGKCAGVPFGESGGGLHDEILLFPL